MFEFKDTQHKSQSLVSLPTQTLFSIRALGMLLLTDPFLQCCSLILEIDELNLFGR